MTEPLSELAHKVTDEWDCDELFDHASEVAAALRAADKEIARLKEELGEWAEIAEMVQDAIGPEITPDGSKRTPRSAKSIPPGAFSMFYIERLLSGE